MDDKFISRQKFLDDYLDAIISLDTKIDISFRLKIDFLIASMKKGISLEYLNDILRQYIEIFLDLGINLVSNDFNYSMFTKEYMEIYFFNDCDKLIKLEKIIFDCPDFISHMKLCLKDIVFRNKMLLEKRLFEKIDNKVQLCFPASNLNFLDDYLNYKEEFKWERLRNKNINTDISKNEVSRFYSNYYKLDLENKLKVNEEFKELYNSLDVLNKFYKYKFILDDMIKRYNNRSSCKTNYDKKVKELIILDELRINLNKDYYECFKLKIFKNSSIEKSKFIKLQISSEVVKIYSLCNEIDDYLFNKSIEEELNDNSSMYDYFELSLKSFSYLKKMFEIKFKDVVGFNLENVFYNYINFIYNLYSKYLFSVNALNYDLSALLIDKFVDLGFSININDISVDEITGTLDVLEAINKNILLK